MVEVVLRWGALALWCIGCSGGGGPRQLTDAPAPIDAMDPGDLPGGNDLTRSYAAGTVTVDAHMNIYAAGLASTATVGGGGLPAAFQLTDLDNPSVLQLLVVGHGLSCCGVALGNRGADGNTNLQTAIVAKSGVLSGIAHYSRNLFLTGVFVAAPSSATPPPTQPPVLAYFHPGEPPPASPPWPPISDAALDYSPQLNQVFFIGDGRGLDDKQQLAPQTFHVPAGAVTLYLGYADGINIGDPDHGTPSPAEPGSYNDNGGEATVHIGTRYHGVGIGALECAPGATAASLDAATRQMTAAIGGTSTHVSFDWTVIEPAPPGPVGTPTYNWQVADDQVERALADGLEPFAFTGNVPRWILRPSCPPPPPPSTVTCDMPAPPNDDPIDCQGNRAFPDDADRPDAEAIFRRFFDDLARRYCGKVHYFEFWNEENGCGSIEPQCRGDTQVTTYVKWLQIWYQTIKAACPDSVLAVGGLACANLDPARVNDCRDYLQAINNLASGAGMGTIYDAVSVHPYGTLDLAQNKALNWPALAGVMGVLQGTGKKLWLDEWGWESRPKGVVAGTPAYDLAMAKGESDKVAAMKVALSTMAAVKYDGVIEMRYLIMNDIPGAWWGLADWNTAGGKLVLRPSGCELCRQLHGGALCTAQCTALP